MKRKFVILKAPASSATRAPLTRRAAIARATPPDLSNLKIEIDALSRKDVRKIRQDKSVVSIAPAMPVKLIEPVRSKKKLGALPKATTQWGIGAVGADTSPFTGAGIVVAVLDTGIDPNHPAFAGVKLTRKNFTSESANDLHGHGTHCAGTIFGRDVNGTRIGIARGVTKAVIGKVLGEGGGSSDKIVEALQWAAQSGAHIVSMSLGIDFPGAVKELIAGGWPADLAASAALDAYRANVLLFERLASLFQANALFGQTTLLIAAAGNESAREINDDYEINVSPPAVADGMISVAALGETTGSKLTVATFSNIGATVSGPGVNILSAKPGGGLVAMSGTSMATPHVAGIAALWGQKLVGDGKPLDPEEWTARLVASATLAPIAAGNVYADVGAGLVQAPQ